MTAADDLAAARARLSAVTDRLAARQGSSRPDPATIDATAGILAVPPPRRDVSVSVHPATVWRVRGHLVAVYRFGSLVGAVATAECSCPDEGPCETCWSPWPGPRRAGEQLEQSRVSFDTRLGRSHGTTGATP